MKETTIYRIIRKLLKNPIGYTAEYEKGVYRNAITDFEKELQKIKKLEGSSSDKEK